MQTIRRPWRSGAHRLASIALYRSLLGQCNKLANEEQKQALRNVVRNRFRANRRVTSHNILRVAFDSGYSLVNLLDNALKNDEASLTELDGILEETLPHEKREPPLTPPQFRDRRRPPPKGPKPGRLDDYDGILSRPRPIDEATLTKPRKVPNLFLSSRGMPFLRTKKPQPPRLSAHIRQNELKFFRRTTQLSYLFDKMQPIAKEEDEWDRILQRTFGLSPISEVLQDSERETNNIRLEFRTWNQSVEYGINQISRRLTATSDKHARTYYKMLAIVEKEKELAKEEARILQARQETNTQQVSQHEG